MKWKKQDWRVTDNAYLDDLHSVHNLTWIDSNQMLWFFEFLKGHCAKKEEDEEKIVCTYTCALRSLYHQTCEIKKSHKHSLCVYP